MIESGLPPQNWVLKHSAYNYGLTRMSAEANGVGVAIWKVPEPCCMYRVKQLELNGLHQTVAEILLLLQAKQHIPSQHKLPLRDSLIGAMQLAIIKPSILCKGTGGQ